MAKMADPKILDMAYTPYRALENGAPRDVRGHQLASAKNDLP
jgi:hypothetical protein